MSDAWTAVVIEDDVDVRELITLVLEQTGFTVVTASTGPEGVEAVRLHDPVLTTLDLHLPGIDGFAVARRLREFSSTYLIMITGMVSEIDVIRGFEAGADDYLVKPFRFRELRARADSMMRRPRVRHENAVGWAEGEKAAAVADATKPPGTVVRAVSDLEPPGEPDSWAKQAADQLGGAGTMSFPATMPPPPPQEPPVRIPAPATEAVVVPAPAPEADGSLRHGPLVLHPGSSTVQVDGRRVQVDSVDAALLACLLGPEKRVRSKAELVLVVRGETGAASRFVTEAEKRSLDARLTALRAQLGDDGEPPRLIETVRGVGYRMARTA